MRTRKRLIGLIVATMVLSVLPAMAGGAAAQEDPAYRVLVFAKTEDGSRAASTRTGITAIQQLGDEHGFRVIATRESNEFDSARRLSRFSTVVFLNTDGDVLDDTQQATFEDYIRNGGGFVGINTAGSTEPDWGFYGDLLGARATDWADTQPADLRVLDRAHPATADLPARWDVIDAVPNFDDDLRGDAHILATVDEDSYEGGSMGHNHPVTWCHTVDEGRALYTGLGTSPGTYASDSFRTLLAGAIAWTAGAVEGDCDATVWDNFEKVILTREVGEPMSMTVLPDGGVLHTNRQGQIRLWDPNTAATRIITSLPVYQFSEDGMQGIAIDPDFEENNWLYIYYAPVIPGFPEGAAPEGTPDTDPSIYDEWIGYNQLSRFKFVDDPVNPYVDLTSEQQILRVPSNRGLCCHVGGDIDFDSEGNLYLSTGDDTNPFQSNNYTPIDERPWRNPGFDAQRTSANTADLRGKILRITVQEDGSYTVPDDNMFNGGEWDHLFPDGEYDPELGLPEIYAMGFRNPFRMSVDPRTDTVYVGDYGPDANQPSPTRGPRATVEWVILDGPRNHGWPYCVGNGLPYIDYDFATGASGEAFDCDNPVNESHRNTGLVDLPPMTPAEVWYHNNIVMPEFPEMGSGGGGPMGGPVYHYDPDLDSPTKFPEYYDGIAMFYEWTRNMIKQMVLDDEGDLLEIRGFFDGTTFFRPMDMEFGPDGALYVLEYGGGFFVEHPDASLARIDYVADGRSPVARAAAVPRSGQPPLEVTFSSAGSHHPEEDGEIVSYHWAFGDGATSTNPNPTHTYTANGVYTATLTVTDADDRFGRVAVTITVGNTAPTVELVQPLDGQFMDWDDEIPFEIDVTDPEDGDIDCDEVVLNTAIGHDGHAHPMGEQNACEGTFETSAGDHGTDLNLYWVVSARYTDHGAPGLPSLTSEDQATLQPRRKQAQYFTEASGVTTQNASDPAEGGGQRLNNVSHGDWTAYDPVNFVGIDELRFRVRTNAGWPGGTIEVRADAPDGTLLGSAAVPDTGGDWTFVTTSVTDPGDTITLYLVYTNPAATTAQNLFNVNFFEAIDG